MKKLFAVMVNDVDRMHATDLYFVKAENAQVAEKVVREILIEDYVDCGVDISDLDDSYDFDVREFDENAVINV